MSFLKLIRKPLRSTLFPYTTLFRSENEEEADSDVAGVDHIADEPGGTKQVPAEVMEQHDVHCGEKANPRQRRERRPACTRNQVDAFDHHRTLSFTAKPWNGIARWLVGGRPGRRRARPGFRSRPSANSRGIGRPIGNAFEQVCRLLASA